MPTLELLVYNAWMEWHVRVTYEGIAMCHLTGHREQTYRRMQLAVNNDAHAFTTNAMCQAVMLDDCAQLSRLCCMLLNFTTQCSLSASPVAVKCIVSCGIQVTCQLVLSEMSVVHRETLNPKQRYDHAHGTHTGMAGQRQTLC